MHVSKVAMMAALGAVAQHYIKFPGFDAGWQGIGGGKEE
jgi:hypothetical protein